MERTKKQASDSPGMQAAYLPPVMETVEISVEKGFAASIEEMPDYEWY